MSTLTHPVNPDARGAGLFVARDRKHLLGLEHLTRAELLALLDRAAHYRTVIKNRAVPTDELRGVTVCNAFFEDSTRTRMSFELAEHALGVSHVRFHVDGSSVSKGETLLDTMRVIVAMGVDLVVIRHPTSGVAHHLAQHLDASIINAGDGRHEHPTQGLLDLMTLREAWEDRWEGRRIAIVGDIAHSRVARSAIFGLRTLGADVTLAGPAPLLPAGIDRLGVRVAPTTDEAMRGADVVMALRIQRERMQGGVLPPLAEYASGWCITRTRVERMKPGAVVLHPGPVNRGVEIAPEVADGPRSMILKQVENGVVVRCAVLRHAAGALAREVA